MKYTTPKVNGASRGGPKVNTGELVGRALRGVVRHVKNPVVEAIFEEMSPEIDEILQVHLKGSEVDLETLQNGLNRAGRVIQRIANQRRQTA